MPFWPVILLLRERGTVFRLPSAIEKENLAVILDQPAIIISRFIPSIPKEQSLKGVTLNNNGHIPFPILLLVDHARLRINDRVFDAKTSYLFYQFIL